MKIFPLKADYGDALVIEAQGIKKNVRIVIDGGPETTSNMIANYYNSLEFIDLLILTHFDEDHIKGLLEYFSKLEGTEKKIGLIWSNCARIIDFDNEENTSSYEDAFNLATYLNRLQKKGLIGEWRDDIDTNTPTLNIDGVVIDVLSPTPKHLTELHNRYQDYIEQHGLKDDPDTDEEISYKNVLLSSTKSLFELASKFKQTYTTFMNTTSIAVRLFAEGKTLLLLADAEPSVIADSLERYGSKESEPMYVDLVKVSHHGSKANISPRLLKLIDCTHYLFTTSGGDAGAYHPDRMTIACLNYWPRKRNNEKLTLYFNYPLQKIMERNTGLLQEKEKELFNIIDHYPNQIPTINI